MRGVYRRLRVHDSVTTGNGGANRTGAGGYEATPVSFRLGQELDVRLQTPLSSETSTVEQRFESTAVVDVMQNGPVLIPTGSIVHGVVADVKRPGRIDRQGSLAVVRPDRGAWAMYQIRGLATQVFESSGIREEAGTAGAGAGVGAVVGGLLGGCRVPFSER